MSKKANPTLIGAFVVAALAIAFTGIVILGSGKLFTDSEQFVLFFDGSLSGLDVGAPVEYNGIRIGEVVDIRMEYNTDTDQIQLPVYVEIEPQKLIFRGADAQRKSMSDHIKNGIRAQLQSQSFVTGKIKIMLVFDPSSPAVLVGHDLFVEEIPTKARLMENIGKSIDELPLEDIVNNINLTLLNLAKITDSSDIPVIVSELRNVSEKISSIASSGDIQAILKEVRTAAESLAKITDTGEIQQVTQSLNKTLAESTRLVQSLHESIGPVRQDLAATLEEINATAQSARYLMDYLERHPEALLRGKGGE